mgnify:CR=1 FL=1
MYWLPAFGLRAYAWFYSKFGSKRGFSQSELDWIVSEPMKKKIFSALVRAGWLVKKSRFEYACIEPRAAVMGVLEPRIEDALRNAKLIYCLTGASAIEAWSDYSYVQRSVERSPFFLKVLKKDVGKWKKFFASKQIPFYEKKGGTVGEFIILQPVEKIEFAEKNALRIERLKETVRQASKNYLYEQPLEYIRKKYARAL